ncbi:MAG: YbaN family protein [Oscillospiraceae bacterium]|jgi:uncharacterized membrane protein YbaN (DUF454 family)|nr:YbaN family protein [Oscillospiraceae bacterium]
MKKLVKPLFIALGFITFAVGTVGIFLPVLPTTPLYLVTAFCFARGSTRFHNWFLGTKLYKKYLDGFVRNRSMPMKTKLAICIPVTVMLLIAIYFAPIWHAQVLIAAVLLFKWYYFLFRIKTEPKGASK